MAGKLYKTTNKSEENYDWSDVPAMYAAGFRENKDQSLKVKVQWPIS
jgi:hypothetical protein